MKSPWLPFAQRRDDPRLRLFCFAHAGGGASLFRRWHEALPPAIEVHPVQLPGRETRFGDERHTRVVELARELADVLQPLLDRPYALFGHSLGALVSYALTREQRARGARLPERLLLSGSSGPQLPRLRILHDMSEAELIDALREMNGTPAAVLDSPEMRALFLPLLRDDFELVETYRVEPDDPLDLPFSLIGSPEDAEVPTERLLAWEAHSLQACEHRVVPGGHFFPATHEAELVASVAEALAPHLVPA